MNIYQLWQNLTEEYKVHPGCVVRGLVPLLGWFDLRNGEIYRVEPPRPRRVASARPATRDELEQVDWAIHHGAFQIELCPIEGLAGGQGGLRTIAQAEYERRVLYQATGQPLESGPL